jgi:hypothetical protein
VNVVRSPHGLLHVVKPRRPKDQTEFDFGYLRTLCGRLATPGWSQRPKELRFQTDPHVCGVCRGIAGAA